MQDASSPRQASGRCPGTDLGLAAAHVAGVDAFFQVGGAQGVAALAFGTETIPAVDKIVGPGNIYVATAKRLVFGQVGIDLVADDVQNRGSTYSPSIRITEMTITGE